MAPRNPKFDPRPSALENLSRREYEDDRQRFWAECKRAAEVAHLKEIRGEVFGELTLYGRTGELLWSPKHPGPGWTESAGKEKGARTKDQLIQYTTRAAGQLPFYSPAAPTHQHSLDCINTKGAVICKKG